MKYIPHTPDEIREMLAAIGLDSVDAMFESIPPPLRLSRDLRIPDGLSEVETIGHLKDIATRNRGICKLASFVGAGLYPHYVPRAVDALVQRGEFLTAYTPYQAEVAQGTLQAIFEFQTAIAEIFAMDVVNASMYDGSTALAEALLLGLRVTRRSAVAVSEGVHPEYREVARCYLDSAEQTLHTLGLAPDGTVDRAALRDLLAGDEGRHIAAVAVAQPNFLGVVEDFTDVAESCAEHGAKLILCTTEPLAFGLITPPGEMGVDIVVGEGMGFGNLLSFGGPSLGLFATRQDLVRQMPGRLVGETVDSNGERAYTLTLSTREQHIRRDRATSNICTNQGLCALAALIHLSLLGRQGFVELARLCFDRAHHLAERIDAIPGYRRVSDAPFFHELAFETPRPAAEIIEAAYSRGVVPGVDLRRFDAARERQLLVAVTELCTPADLDRLVEVLAEVA